MEQQLITMAQKELSRYEIIQNLIAGRINGSEAAKQIGLTIRQVKRIKFRVIREGARGVIHKNRGRKSNRRIKEDPTFQVRIIDVFLGVKNFSCFIFSLLKIF